MCFDIDIDSRKRKVFLREGISNALNKVSCFTELIGFKCRVFGVNEIVLVL